MSNPIMDRLADYDAAVTKQVKAAFLAREEEAALIRALEAAEAARIGYFKRVAFGEIEASEAEESRLVGEVNRLSRQLVNGRSPAAQAKVEAAKVREREARAERDAFIRRHAADIEAVLMAESDAVEAEAYAAKRALETALASWQRVASHWSAVAEGLGIDRRSASSHVPRAVVDDALSVLNQALQARATKPLPMAIAQRRAIAEAELAV